MMKSRRIFRDAVLNGARQSFLSILIWVAEVSIVVVQTLQTKLNGVIQVALPTPATIH